MYSTSMGVDINTYRCRVGMFIPGGGCGLMSLFITFGRVANFLGFLPLVRILLFMAGVEQNPGPADKYIFRYQYLLVEIGTNVMRKVFNFQVGSDFVKYLHANSNKFYKQLQRLISAKIITADQAQHLPPVDMLPNEANFDITLLACLLRNVCGLRGKKDPVWMNPPSTDLSVEADLARLKECRNNLQHSGTVFISEADLSVKWNELSQILNRLNTVCGIPNLSSLINNAESMNIDEELKKRYDQAIKAWTEMDKLFESGIEDLKLSHSDIKDGQSEIKCSQDTIIEGQSNLNVGQAKLKHGQTEIKKGLEKMQKKFSNTQQGIKRQIESLNQSHPDNKRKRLESEFSEIRNCLVKIYKEECCTLPVSPLCDEDEDEVEILSIYKPPSLYHVPYHRTQEQEEKYSISSYKEIFCKDDRSFRKIYITGDAGVGKTSFCKRMAILWCKSQCGESVGDKSIQTDIDYMAKFDFAFYVSLRDTHRKDVVMMIIEQLFGYENELKQKENYDYVENILRNKECIIIMDALDEWTPAESGKININKLLSDKCFFVTTCRPYKIENERLSPRDLDRQVQITGIKESSTECYVREILNHINRANVDNKEPNDFIRDVNKSGLKGQLRIPIITSHLVAVWYDHKLTDMSRALIYSNIVDMLLKRAEKRKSIELPSSAESEIEFPDSLSKLFYFKKHISFLKKICLLSFNLLFKQDQCLSELVFTSEQLESEPYSVSVNEMDFLCKFGILSKSKVIGRFGKREQKLSYLHKTYLEYFAALFVSSFDFDNVFDNIVQKWTTINEFLQFENFFILFVGLSIHKSKCLFENMYHTISDDLSLCRKNAIFHYDWDSYNTQIEALQNMVIHCFKEVSGSNDPNIAFKLEDFIYDSNRAVHNDSSNVDHLKQILLFNTTCVKSLKYNSDTYYDEFDQIQNLQCLHVGAVLSADYVKFTQCMLQNQSTLHTVCFKGNSTLIPEFPVRSLQHLTSLSLSDVKMQHNNLHNLLQFLSDNVLIENINLSNVDCDYHKRPYSECTLTLNLPHHTQLTTLCLWDVNILCYNVNISSLKYIALSPFSERIARRYIDILNCIKDSHLEYLEINGCYKSDNNTCKQLTNTVKTLPYIKTLELWKMKLPDDVPLQLHPDATQVEIQLMYVILSRQCFHSFIESIVNTKYVMEVSFLGCIITSLDGETHAELSVQESVEYMSENLKSIPTVNITYKDSDRDGNRLEFETRSCQ